MLTQRAFSLSLQLVVKPLQNKGVDERNRRDLEAEERRTNPGATLHDKMGQVTLQPAPCAVVHCCTVRLLSNMHQHNRKFQYEAMASAGYRDNKECFLVDFEQKRWDLVKLLRVVMCWECDVGCDVGGGGVGWLALAAAACMCFSIRRCRTRGGDIYRYIHMGKCTSSGY